MPIALWVTMSRLEAIEPEAEVVGSESVRSDKVSVPVIDASRTQLKYYSAFTNCLDRSRNTAH